MLHFLLFRFRRWLILPSGSLLTLPLLCCLPQGAVTCGRTSPAPWPEIEFDQWEALAGDKKVGAKDKPGCLSLSRSTSGGFSGIG